MKTGGGATEEQMGKRSVFSFTLLSISASFTDPYQQHACLLSLHPVFILEDSFICSSATS